MTGFELNALEQGERVALSLPQVERYTCGCEPGSLRFCHLHSPEPADLPGFQGLDVLERGDQRHENPGE